MENVPDVGPRVDEAKPVADLRKPLLGRQQDSEPGARDVVESAQIDHAPGRKGEEAQNVRAI